jgi:tRNA(Arg) A34 adenosine deaminase TadA
MTDDTSILEDCLRIALGEAEASLRDGNHGFGAVIVREGRILAATHDTDETDCDPTAHAELKVIRLASASVGKDLSSCTLVCTHEPCPMCAGAIIWSKLGQVAFGYGISDALMQGRERIPITCEEIFERSHASIHVHKGLLRKECAILYNRDVRKDLRRLQDATEGSLREYGEDLARRRAEWFQGEGHLLLPAGQSTLEQAYRLLLARLSISEAEAPVSARDEKRIVFQSRNFCPTLEACRILRLDTRTVCRLCTEEATDRLVKQVDPRLRFRRNYQAMRPHSDSCEEMIEYAEPEGHAG